MRTTTIATARPRRLVAATAALGLALALGACSPDNDDDTAGGNGTTTAEAGENGEAGDTATGEAGENGDAPTAEEEPGQAAGERPEGAPTAPIEELLLTDGEAPGYGLTAVPSSQLTESVKAMGGIAEGARVDPPECADFNQAALDAQQVEGATALAAGEAAGTQVSVAVTSATDGIRTQGGVVDRCPTMTMTLDMQGAEITVDARNSRVDLAAPEGVEDFIAVSQTSTMNLGGQTQDTTTMTLNGIVRGIGVTVATAATGPELPQEARDAAIALFEKQAEKVRNS